MPETPKKPPKRTTKTEAAKAKQAVEKVIGDAKSQLKKHSIGRPSSYDPVVAEKICELLSEGTPLREICRMEGMPAWRNIYFWMSRDTDLSAHIARAREVGYDAIAEECLNIADDASNDWMERTGDKGAGWMLNGEHVQRSKLRIETRLKLLAKWSNKYSDKTLIAGDPNGAPIKTEESGSGRLFELIRNMEMTKRAG
jgi:hypothetical protein